MTSPSRVLHGTEPIILTSEWLVPWDAQVCCPGCGSQWVHLDSVGNVHTEETDRYTSPIENRGSWVSIPMYCETDPEHRWRLVIGSQKGEVVIGMAADGR